MIKYIYYRQIDYVIYTYIETWATQTLQIWFRWEEKPEANNGQKYRTAFIYP